METIPEAANKLMGEVYCSWMNAKLRESYDEIPTQAPGYVYVVERCRMQDPSGDWRGEGAVAKSASISHFASLDSPEFIMAGQREQLKDLKSVGRGC